MPVSKIQASMHTFGAREQAASRRLAVRDAFMRRDPMDTGLVAPFQMHDIIKCNRIDKTPEELSRFMRGGRFDWFAFCNELEREAAQYVTRENKNPSPRNSPRGLPTLLRTNDGIPLQMAGLPPPAYGGANSPRANGLMSTNASLMARPPALSTVLSPRKLQDARLQRLNELQASVAHSLAGAKQASDAQKYPFLLANTAKGVGLASPRGMGAGGSPRLMAALDQMKPAPPRPRDRRPKPTRMAAAEVVEEAAEVQAEVAFKKIADPEEVKKAKQMLQDQIASHFSDIRKAFRYVDLNNSGGIDKEEIKRAMQMWNIPIPDDATLDQLMKDADTNGDGKVDYDEFVDALARDTVAPAAMGKRGMQSLEAMGEDSQALLHEMLGHKKVKNFKYPGADV